MTNQISITFDGYDLVCRGKTFDVKDTIKQAGFRWDSNNKQWKLKDAGPKPMEIAENLKKQLEVIPDTVVTLHEI